MIIEALQVLHLMQVHPNPGSAPVVQEIETVRGMLVQDLGILHQLALRRTR
jgi:hypothetical protein